MDDKITQLENRITELENEINAYNLPSLKTHKKNQIFDGTVKINGKTGFFNVDPLVGQSSNLGVASASSGPTDTTNQSSIIDDHQTKINDIITLLENVGLASKT